MTGETKVIRLQKDDFDAVIQLAAKMQLALKRVVHPGEAAGHACRYMLAETKRVEEEK